MNRYDIIIIGGGYAGVMCALRLSAKLRKTKLTIALINPRQEFVERIRLHESLAVLHTKNKRSFNIKELLEARGVNFITGKVEIIDRVESCIHLGNKNVKSEKLRYERLVIAAGTHSQRTNTPGLSEYAYTMDVDAKMGVDALRTKLATIDSPKAVIIGAGATGTEIAAEIALKPGAKVTLIDRGKFGGFVLPAIEKYIRNRLETIGVNLLEHTEVTQIEEGKLSIGNRELQFDVCISAIGFVTPGFIHATDLPVGDGGRLLSDHFLRSLADDRIYIAGDAALPVHPCGAPPRMSVFYALATGAFVAGAIGDEIKGKNLKPFGYWTYGQAIGLGKAAIGYNSIPFDKAVRPYFTGRAAFHLRNFFISVLFNLIKLESHLPGLPFYLGQSIFRQKQNGKQQ